MSEKEISSTGERPLRPQDEEQGSLEDNDFYAVPRGKGELEVVHIRESTTLLRKLRAAEAWLDKKLGVEKIGAERIPEDQRHPPKVINVSFNLSSVLPRS